jgi:tetratricopeptide (TPR) repeat protein
VQEVGRDLGVRYVLEGSVRRSADRVRITAQLIDATSGHHVWAERYDEERSDVFALQDQVTRKVAAALGGERGLIRRAGYLHAWEKPITVLDEYDYFLRIHMLIYQFTKDGMAQAQQVALEGLQRFPESSLIRIKLGWVLFQLARRDWSDEPERDLEQAFQLASEGLAGRNLPPIGQWHGHWLMSNLQVWHKRDYEQALAERDIALALAPADADTLVQLCEVQLYSDKPEDCIASVESAMHMGPRLPPWFPGYAGWAHYLNGHYQRAIELARGSRPIIAAASYAALDRTEEARELAAKVLKGSPKLTLTYLRATQPYRNKEHLERLLDHLRKAGVPES